MRVLHVLLLPVLAVFMMGSSPSQVSLKAENIDWLMGNWQGEFNKAKITESWQKIDDGLYSGKGFVFGDRDTFVREQLRIQRIANYWAFIPVINNQPPVLFTLIKSENHMLVFENKEHDFPQRVTYSLEDGQLHAWIEGLKGEKQVKEDYWYSKK